MIMTLLIVGPILYFLIAVLVDRVCIKFTDIHSADRTPLSIFWPVSLTVLLVMFLFNNGLNYLVKGIDRYLTRFEKKQ